MGVLDLPALRRHRSRRAAIVAVVLVVIVLGASVIAISLGASGITPARVFATLAGFGDRGDQFVVFRLRLPRIVTAIVAGFAFGLAGALFQSVLSNPLASPDILGVSAGASFAAVFVLLVAGGSGFTVSAGAFVGAFVIAALMWVLAWRGGLVGYRFVLIGVGLGYVVTAALGWMITRADVREVSQALVWMVGGVGGASWSDIGIAAGIVLAASVAIVGLGRRLPVLALGDDAARGLGVRGAVSRGALLLAAVALVAAATALAGPIAFVALISAPIARALLRDGGAALLSSALIGSVLVVVADLVGQHVLADSVPVGIVTGVIGAPYLLWLIATSNRKGADG